ncbi:hypothetical protein CANINC_002310 [Pichia inconspicua]|uniref:Pyridoxamine kinase/Phosphomethylpyrimidine kinase domain-containing protein n=1 Tax=Pichia inconspicua TaxID=52247 RepID=A0A4V4NFR5_9ASCO|nr:hypothetical protein CANINC_002310 [[Candida] inconspicua]
MPSSEYNQICIDLFETESRETIGRIRESKFFPTVLTVAGSDSSGGAGIEADIKTISAHNCYALTGIDALTAQNTLGVKGVVETGSDMIDSILEQDFADIRIDAIKTGILTSQACASLGKIIQKYNYTGPLVVDPVLVSTSGFNFVQNETLLSIFNNLSRYITIITPNMVEAKAIVNTLSHEKQYNDENMETLEDIFVLCQKIHALTNIKYILVKGGHQEWKTDTELLTDVLFHSESNIFYIIRSRKMCSKSTHGTGCTLSAAIASNLANGLKIVNAVVNGIVYVQQGIKDAPKLGSGCGPLNHLQKVTTLNYDICDSISFSETESVFDALFDNPELKSEWDAYIDHPFFLSIYRQSITKRKFAEFCLQNRNYLIAYSQIIAILISKSKQPHDMKLCAEKLSLTFDELNKYEEYIEKLAVSESEIENTESAERCNEYTGALFDLAESSVDFLDIYASLLPCTVGYYFACLKAKSKYQTSPRTEMCDPILKSWTDGMDSPAWNTFVVNEKKYLNQLFRDHCQTQTKYNRLLSIIKISITKETEFLNSFL